MSKNIILHFGKYNTKNIEEVDPKYLRWFYNANKDKHLSPYMKDILGWIKEHIELDEEPYQAKNEPIMNFGKYKDKKLSEIPKTYINWLYNNNKDKEEYKSYNKILANYL
jgi:uncharacterized protein (DUF3820 family)